MAFVELILKARENVLVKAGWVMRMADCWKRALFGVIAVFCLSLFANCQRPSNDETNSFIAKSPELIELNDMCNNLPKPPGFEFREKSLVGSWRFSVVSFTYTSSSPFSSTVEFYEKYFTSAGWEKTEVLEGIDSKPRYVRFKNDRTFVSIERVNFDNANIVMGCGHTLY